jgi:hypothetical protein
MGSVHCNAASTVKFKCSEFKAECLQRMLHRAAVARQFPGLAPLRGEIAALTRSAVLLHPIGYARPDLALRLGPRHHTDMTGKRHLNVMNR